MQVINFFGSAGAGKTTAAYGLAHEMKKRYVEVEFSDEYAKRLFLAQSTHMLADQLSILAEQNARLHYANNPVHTIDYVITDAPLMLSAFYSPANYPPSFRAWVVDLFKMYDNINIFLKRSHAYNPRLRQQSEHESDIDSDRMEAMLQAYNIPYITMNAGDEVPLKVLRQLDID